MKRFAFSCCGMMLIFLLHLGLSPASAVEPQEKLREKLLAKMAAMDCPGALVGIFPDDGEPTRLALGVTDVKTKAPMTLDQHMRVASVTKPMLGAVILQLAQEGKISLDDPISNYVAGVPNGDKITLRMLGRNTSGIFNTIENKKFQFAIMDKPGKVWETDEILKLTWEREPYNAPGEKFRYSNTNAVLLGMAIEKVTGTSYGEQIQKRVCEPLKLAHTGIAKDGKLPKPHTSAYRHGYQDKVIGYGDVFYDVSNYSSAWTHAAGSLYSTLDDLGLAAKPIATGTLLSEASRKELLDWKPTNYERVEYSFLLGKRDGRIGHTGDVPGYNAVMQYHPEKKVSIVVLTNLSNNKDGTMPAEEIAKLLWEEVGK